MIVRIINALGNRSPNFLAERLANIPFKYRSGKNYSIYREKISQFETFSLEEKEHYVVTHFDKIFQHAKKIKMYEEKYKEAGVYDLKINSLADISKIPILTKNEIRKNISQFNGYYSQNTGGTTGKPMPLYLDKNVWNREWAHYHTIWESIGYDYKQPKFFFRGINLNKHFIKYDFEHNNYMINLYKDPQLHLDAFFKILNSKKIKYFQGYPSAIVDFLRKIDSKITNEQRRNIKEQVEFCFFNSEYPTPQMIKYITEKWGFKYMSCYGHSEVCVLAWAKNNLDYSPMFTYGYTEVDNGSLIGTSYHNFDMPLIRYNTDDLVKASFHPNGMVKSFKINEGRVGDFIIDKNSNSISLTALLFGRHHEIFNHINHIQVYQKKKGEIILCITGNDKKIEKGIHDLLDLSGIDVEVEFKFLEEPIRTNSGKIPLKLNKL